MDEKNPGETFFVMKAIEQVRLPAPPAPQITPLVDATVWSPPSAGRA